MSSVSTLCGGPVGGCRRARPDARVLVFAVFAMGVCLLAISAAPALAVRGHVFGSVFGAPGSGDGQLAEPEGVAVSEATGDVYVVDRGNSRVVVFSATGGFVEAWGWGVADGKAEYEVCEGGCQAGVAGPGEGQLEQAKSIAVDNTCALHELKDATHKKLSSAECEALDPSNGDVYVESGVFGEELVEKFSATGAPLGEITGPGPGPGSFNEGGGGGVEGVAVDPRGELWVLVAPTAGEGADNFDDHTVNGFIAFRGLIPGGAFDHQGFAVDAEDNSYVRLGQHTVAEFNAKGELLNRVVGEEPVGEPGYNGVAVEAVTGDSYVDDATSVARRGPFAAAGSNPSEEPAGNPLVERFGEGALAGQLHLGACETFGAGGEASCRGGVAVSSVSGRVYVVSGAGDEVVGFVLEPPAAPAVSEQSVSRVTSGSVAFSASVNPRSDPGEEQTAWWFEYVTQATFEREGFASARRAPVPAGSLAPEYRASVVGAEAQGLSAGTAYRYRLVAENQVSRGEGRAVQGELNGKGEELVRSFTTQAPGVFPLLDERGWELVSPPLKLGAALLGIGTEFALQAAAGGGALTYVASAPTEGEASGNAQVTQVLSWRGSGGGWSSRDLSLPHAQATALAEHPEYPLFSEDLSLAAVQPLGGFIACTEEGPACLSGEASEQTAFVRMNYPAGSPGAPCVPAAGTDCYRPLVTGAEGFANVPAGTVFGVKEGGAAGTSQTCPPEPFCGPQFEGASPDLSHVLVSSRAELVEGSGVGGSFASGREGLFEWSGGALKFVGRGEVGAGREEEANNFLTVSAHAVSGDGSRVIFSGESPDGQRGLLLRDTASEQTLRLAGSEAVFLTASSDGSRVFFTSDTGGPLEECEVIEVEGALECNASGKPLDLTGGAGILAPIPGASQDGSYVYFASGSVLTSVPDARGEVAGECPGAPALHCVNLYVLHEGTTSLVAVLSSNDSPDWGNGEYSVGGGKIKRVKAAVLALTARVSPDGRWLAFMSQRSLTGYDNLDARTGQPDEEVFLYDAGAGRVICASCDPTGARPSGVQAASLKNTPVQGFSETWPAGQGIAASVPGWSTDLYQSRYLSDGGRLFFDSAGALVPQDTNSTQDVYEFEPAAGAGAPAGDRCTPATPGYEPGSQGCVGLISGARSAAPSGFLDASESGEEVFFLTTAALSKRDPDTAYDIYDARVHASEPEPPPPPVCVGDSCQPTTQPPEEQTPGSLTFQGPGNLISPLTPPPPPLKPTAAQVRHEKLLKALKVCRRHRGRRRRRACERAARRAYGPLARRSSATGGARP